MVVLDDISYKVLDYFYNVFLKVDTIKLKKEGSVFFQFIENTSGNRADILRNSTVNTEYEDIPRTVIEELVEDNYIMRAECNSCFALTAKGLFTIEEHRGLIDLEKLLIEFHKKYFSVFKGEGKLKDVEKIVLFSLLCSRSFSLNACMKVDSFGRENDTWKRIFRKSAMMLKDMEIISVIHPKLEETEEGYETPLMYIMRRMNNLQEKTRNIYRFNKNRCYYLDLDVKNEISISGVTFLFQKVFDRVLSLTDMESITEFMNRISSEEIIHMNEHNGRKYSKPEIDLLLERSLQDAVIGKN